MATERTFGRTFALGMVVSASVVVGTSLAVAYWRHLLLARGQWPGGFDPVFWVCLSVGAVLVVGGTAVLQLFLWRPLRRLSEAMKRAEEGDFLVRAELRGPAEVSELARAFNRMLARLTEMKVEEIDTQRDLVRAQAEISLKTTLENRIRELTLLYEMAGQLTSTLELPELLTRITRLVAERLHIPQFSVMLAGPDLSLEVKSAYPPGLGTEGIAFARGEGVCGKAAVERTRVYVPDITAPSSIYRMRSGGEKETGSLLCVPMTHIGKLLGVLNFQRPEPSAFSLEEIELLTAVAELASLAVSNARLHEETVALSITDPLTGAPNRRHLFQRLEVEVARANRFGTQLSILMVDIDHFKQLNDANGHRAGDDVLRRVADLLRLSVRKVDLVARYGGEEFLIILPQVTKAEAIEVAEKLRQSIEDTPFEYGPSQPLGKVTISVGAANLPSDATQQDQLVDCADSALYAAKRAGRNKAIGYATGMELHPGRERGPHAAKRNQTAGVVAAAKTGRVS
jgi:diguanylate cyclase (GGDEF)-like protein